jgi:hypothetical protein
VSDDGDRWWASMLQGEPELGPELDRAAAMAAAGLDPADTDVRLPAQIDISPRAPSASGW